MTILLTGIAGFIGSNTAKKLLERGDEIIRPLQCLHPTTEQISPKQQSIDVEGGGRQDVGAGHDDRINPSHFRQRDLEEKEYRAHAVPEGK